MGSKNTDKHAVRSITSWNLEWKAKVDLYLLFIVFSGSARMKSNNYHNLYPTFTVRSFYIQKLIRTVKQF